MLRDVHGVMQEAKNNHRAVRFDSVEQGVSRWLPASANRKRENVRSALQASSPRRIGRNRIERRFDQLPVHTSL